MSLSFLFISTKINQSIWLNSFLENYFNDENTLNNKINNNTIWKLNNDENLFLSSNSIELNKWENYTFSFFWNSVFTWSIRLKSGWPIYFQSISYSSDEIVSSTWIIYNYNNTIFTWILDSTYANSELIISNLWWYADFWIELSTWSVFTWSTLKYKIVKNIWWKNVEKQVVY